MIDETTVSDAVGCLLSTSMVAVVAVVFWTVKVLSSDESEGEESS